VCRSKALRFVVGSFGRVLLSVCQLGLESKDLIRVLSLGRGALIFEVYLDPWAMYLRRELSFLIREIML
jgi:hypothetical protein